MNHLHLQVWLLMSDEDGGLTMTLSSRVLMLDILDKGDSEERSQRITWKIVNIHIKNLKKEDSDMLQAACQLLIVE
nr:hypothetical protein [Tanacetum cinerariifolium]